MDAEKHSLEWAVRVETPSAETVNDTVLLLGRQVVLEITAVEPYSNLPEMAALKQVMQNVTFKEGQR